MKYLADVLTWSRIGVSIVMLMWAVMDLFNITHVNYAVVLIVAAFAFLTDALDGICARRWPYPALQRAKIPWHKTAESSHQFDNTGDLLLYASLAISLVAADGIWWWVILGAAVYTVAVLYVIEQLMKRRSPWAEKLDVLHGWVFGVTLGVMLAFVAAMASPHKWGWFLVAGIAVALVMVPSKWDRLTTRPERRF